MIGRDANPHHAGRIVLASRIAAAWFALAVLLAAPAAVSADPGDLGFEGPDGTGAGAAPSGSKPEAKLWFNDGIWWASMWDQPTADFYIWKLDRGSETWVRTGTRLDDRGATRADVLWDGTKLYVASHNFSESDGSGTARLYRYSYAAGSDTYTLDAGFPATINTVRSETLVIDKDSTGKLWATWEQGGQIFINRTTGSDTTWGSPFVLPGATGVNGDDISTLIAFGGDKVGVMWSNQNASPDAMLFAVHVDGQSDTTWSAPEVALSGTNLADDHINLKTDASGKVYAVTKTSLTGSSPLIKFLSRATTGTWTNSNVATGSENHTRPILVLDLEHSLFRVYMTHGQSGGPIVEKTSPMGSVSWPSGTGTRVIWDASSNDMNNPTSTKQNVTAASGLIVAAFEDTTKHYWHADIFGGGPPPPDTTPPTVTNRSPAVDATGVAVGSNVTATFSEPVTGVSGTTFTLTGPGGAVSASVSYAAGSQTATLDPNAALSPNTTYTAHLSSGITDTSSNNNALVPVDWSFTTADVPPPGTGIAFRAASSANNPTATSLVISTPNGVVSGDVMLAVVAARGAPTITAPAGWTLVRLDINATTMRQAIFVRTAGGSEPGSYTFSLSTAQSAAGGIVAYSGVDGSNPIDAHGGQANAASTSITAPSISTTGPDRMLVGFFGTAALTTIAPPAGMTERFDQTVPATNQFKVTSEASDASVAATGATGPRVALAANSAANVGQLVALRPAP